MITVNINQTCIAHNCRITANLLQMLVHCKKESIQGPDWRCHYNSRSLQFIQQRVPDHWTSHSKGLTAKCAGKAARY